MKFAIDYPWALAGAFVLAALAAGAVWFEVVRRRIRLGRLGPASALERLVPASVMRARLGRRPVWLASAAALAGIAFSGPRWGTPLGQMETEGIDVVYAVDASLSMLATDDSPNRLERAKHEARRLRAMSRGDRVGLIAFAGRSYILTPLTADDGALALFLDNLDPSIVGQPGSSLAAALRQGVDLLGPARSGDRALVVFTDGEVWDEKDAIVTAARRANAAGVAVVFVGFGSIDGSTIPVHVGENAIAPKRDELGRVVTTKYDPALLRAAAEAAHGTMIDASATDKASRIRAALAGLRAERRRVNAQQSVPSRYQWFLLPALLLLLWDVFAARRRPAVAAAAIALALLIPHDAHAQAKALIEGAQSSFHAQHPLEAARAWRRALEAGDRHPETLYNLGTAYLAADSLDAAIEVLERAASIPVPVIRANSLFNLGLAYLKRGMAARGEAAAGSYASAVRAYRSVLLAAPDDSAARWNYELAKKKQVSAQASAGGGGNSQQNQQQNPQNGSLARDQASQLLDAAERDERDAQLKQQHAEHNVIIRGHDW